MSPENKSKKKDWLKYRWEFLRRDPEFMKIYPENYIRNRPDPNLSFEEIWDSLDNKSNEEQMEILNRRIPLQAILELQSAVQIITSKKKLTEYAPYMKQGTIVSYNILEHKKDVGINELVIWIDLEKVNSIDALKNQVLNIIDHYWFTYSSEFKKVKDSRKLIDYDIILKVGDLREKDKLKYQQIARQIFPRDFDANNESANPESAIKKVSNYYKKYKELVNGGWRNLTYP